MKNNPISDSIKKFRYQHDMTQAELAQLSQIPRATLANMESDQGNPSLKAVLKIATALGVSLQDLLENKNGASAITHVKRAGLPTSRKDDDRYQATVLSPVSAPYTRILNIQMLPGCDSLGAPHPKGSHEFFYCIEGTASVTVNEEVVEVPAGDLVYFPGNLPHRYANFGRKVVNALAIVNNFNHSFKKA